LKKNRDKNLAVARVEIAKQKHFIKVKFNEVLFSSGKSKIVTLLLTNIENS
jgi:hypothetical protein